VKNILKSLLRGQKARRQWGFTLVEMVIALAVASLVLVGTAAIFRYLVITTSAGADQTTANHQVQYVSLWIGEDVVQVDGADWGQSALSLGTSPVYGYTVKGFPIDMFLREYKDDGSYTYYGIKYSVDEMPANEKTLGNTLMRLYRARYTGYEPDPPKTLVAEYLDPQGTSCELLPVGNLEQVGNETYILVLKVTARVDQGEASGTYRINPRVYP
jgi:prepilin-type N-terminal cleavage/methylation domain-containing protein